MGHSMTKSIEKIEYDLERARRERDAWRAKNKHQYDLAKMYVASLEKELADAICEKGNDDHKPPDSV